MDEEKVPILYDINQKVQMRRRLFLPQSKTKPQLHSNVCGAEGVEKEEERNEKGAADTFAWKQQKSAMELKL